MTGFDPLEFHERAVATPSHESVEEMRTLLVDALADAGVRATVDEAGNVLASREAEGSEASRGQHVVLNTHVDTVPPHVPFERDGDVVRGRGACDAKGPLAALVAAFLECEPTDGRVTLAITPDEETVQTGAAHLTETLSADGYVVGEPTGLDVCTAARGQFEGTITIEGVSAHAATPGEGTNAIRAVAPILQAMETYDEQPRSRHASTGENGGDSNARGPGAHPTLGRPTLTPTRIEGGEATNQVPAECTVTFDRRSVPPETADGFRAGLEAHLSEWVPAAADLRVRLADREAPVLEAFATDHDRRLVRTLADASGGDIRPFGAATEASLFAADAPTVVFGPGDLADESGAVAHSDREYVRRGDIERAADAVRRTLDALV